MDKPFYEPHHTAKPSKCKADSATGQPGITWLSDVSPGDKPWDEHHATGDQMVPMYQRSDDERHQKLGRRIRECAPTLTMAEAFHRETGEVKLKLSEAFFCRCRTCPTCQWRRALRWKARIIEALPKIKAEFPTHQWIMLTLTIRNVPIEELKEAIRSMNRAYRRMMKFIMWPADGSIKSMEVTKGKDGRAHPHFHCLLHVPGGYFNGGQYLNHEKWRAMWRKAMKLDYDPQIWIERLPRKKQTMEDAVKEVLKYSVKPADLVDEDEWLWALTDQLHHVRAVEVLGSVKKFFKEDDDEMLVVEDKEQPELELTGNETTFDWHRKDARYGRKRKRTVHDDARDFRKAENTADDAWRQAAEEAEKRFQKPH